MNIEVLILILYLSVPTKRFANVFRMKDIWILHPINQEPLHLSRVKVGHDDNDLVPNGALVQDVPDEGAEPRQGDLVGGHQAAAAPDTNIAHSVALVKQCLHIVLESAAGSK